MNTIEFDIHKAAGIIIKDRKLLVEKSFNKDFFIAPGGKINPEETAKAALVRELQEEFQIQVIENDLQEFGKFFHKAAGQPGKTVYMEVFMVRKWIGEPTPGREVEKMIWLTSRIPKDLPVGSIFEHKIIPRLKAKNLID